MSNNALQTIINARLPGKEGLWQIHLLDGKISAIDAQSGVMPVTENSLDAEQGLVIPPFVEPHIHLDTTQTAGQPNWNQSGTLFEGIERWAERKALFDTVSLHMRHCCCRFTIQNRVKDQIAQRAT